MAGESLRTGAQRPLPCPSGCTYVGCYYIHATVPCCGRRSAIWASTTTTSTTTTTTTSKRNTTHNNNTSNNANANTSTAAAAATTTAATTTTTNHDNNHNHLGKGPRAAVDKWAHLVRPRSRSRAGFAAQQYFIGWSNDQFNNPSVNRDVSFRVSQLLLVCERHVFVMRYWAWGRSPPLASVELPLTTT